MERKKLEKTLPEPISKKTSDIVLTAKITEDVLEVDIYERGELLARHFVKKETEEYSTLFMKDKRMSVSGIPYVKGNWYGLKLQTLLANGDTQYSWWARDRKDIHISEEHKEIVAEYLKIDKSWRGKNENVIRMIDNEETNYSYTKKNRAYDRKRKRIEMKMAAVEPITDDKEFTEWIGKVFTNKYIFRENKEYKRGRKYYCATCGKTFFEKKNWKHNEMKECKKCGTTAIVKTRQIAINETKNVIVFQKYDEDTVVERFFRFQQNSYLHEQKAETSYHQQERIRLFLKKGEKTKMYYGCSHSRDADEWEQDWWDTKNGMMFGKRYLVYPGSIMDTNLPKELKDMLIIGANAGKEMDYNELVYLFEERPFLEYLFKSKMLNLASEIISEYSYWSEIKFLDVNATNVPELLKLDKQRANRMKEVDGNIKTLKALQWEMEKGEKISQENLIYITENKIGLDELRIEKTGLSVNKAVNYLRRQIEQNKMNKKQILQFYQDYLDMAADREMDLHDDIVRVNKRMIEFHNLYLEEKNRKANEKRAKDLNRRFANIKKDYQENKAKYGFETEDYIFILPKSAEDIMIEGQQQHHCVGASDTYFDRMNKGQSFIVFMRKKSEPEVPYYTIEIKDTEIKQAYSAYDRQPDYQNVKKELNKWKQEIEKRMRKEKEHGRVAS